MNDHDDPVTTIATVPAEDALATVTRSEIDSQVAVAHRYPRSIARARETAESLISMSRAIAESCSYCVPRGGKKLTGPSIRLAEISASSWGNLQYGGRPLSVGETTCSAQGFAWDMERNVRIVEEVPRRIVGKDGERFNEDMINVTLAAAKSIAMRNAILRVVPRSFVDVLYQHAKAVACGNEKELPERRTRAFDALSKLGVSRAAILRAVDRPSIEDVTTDDLEVLFGLHTSVKEQRLQLAEAFPEPIPEAPEGERVPAPGSRKAQAPKRLDIRLEGGLPQPGQYRTLAGEIVDVESQPVGREAGADDDEPAAAHAMKLPK